jgi:hypothetical protein
MLSVARHCHYPTPFLSLLPLRLYPCHGLQRNTNHRNARLKLLPFPVRATLPRLWRRSVKRSSANVAGSKNPPRKPPTVLLPSLPRLLVPRDPIRPPPAGIRPRLTHPTATQPLAPLRQFPGCHLQPKLYKVDIAGN